jgi:hypothetical protein
VIQQIGDLSGCFVDFGAGVGVLGVIVVQGPVGEVAVAGSVVPIAP